MRQTSALQPNPPPPPTHTHTDVLYECGAVGVQRDDSGSSQEALQEVGGAQVRVVLEPLSVCVWLWEALTLGDVVCGHLNDLSECSLCVSCSKFLN